MKIAIYLLAALLVAALGAAAIFYFQTFEPMLADYNQMKAGMPEMDKARAELKKYKAKETKETRETAWVKPVADDLSRNLAEEIKAGNAEIVQTDNGIILNVAENVLYTPHSVTFAGKETLGVLQRLAASLANQELKGRQIIIGNTTDSVPASGKGKKRKPARDGRSIAADRSQALVKYLEQNKVEAEALVAGAYAAKMPDTGFKIKDRKTIIVIRNLPAPAPQEAKPAAATKQAPKTIPIKPAKPKGQ